MTALCKSPECRASIVWATTASGKRMPLDAQPVTDVNDIRGHFVLDPPPAPHQQTTPRARYAYPDDIERGQPLYTSHFATCPAAPQHRRRTVPLPAGGGPR